MKLDDLLLAYQPMTVQRPPELWEGETESARLVPLLDAMIAVAIDGDATRGDLILNASNIVVPVDDDPDVSDGGGLPAGEFVGLTVRGRTDLGPDATWSPRRPPASGVLTRLHEQLLAAGVTYAYIRRLPGDGSMTVFLRRPAV